MRDDSIQLTSRRRRLGANLLLLVLALLLLASCTGQQGDNAGLNVSGSTSVSPFAEHLAEIYQKQHAGAVVNVQSLGSSAGIQAAISRVADIGMSSRTLAPEEAEQLDQLLIARDALAVIVHPSNPLTNLSQAQVQDIFMGKITSWDEIGGQEQPITIIVREAGSGTFGAFEELVMEKKPVTSGALRQGSNGAIRQLVSLDQNAIGYISLGIVDQTVKAIAIGNVQPSVAHVEDGTYTFVRPFLFVWPKGQTLSPLAQSYVDYVMSPEGQEELTRLGLVPGVTRPRRSTSGTGTRYLEYWRISRAATSGST
jgi:phosphate transport system substrate-binding protein